MTGGLRDLEVKTRYKDAGSLPLSYYKRKLGRARYAVRNFFLPLIAQETETIAGIQHACRTSWRDVYFAYTANLGSHTFYVLMLPLPTWFGFGNVTRDFVYLLGYGIYFTGLFKDLCCLPRPRSPPVHRITLSSYTAAEYGFPSSHTANATSVTLLVLSLLLRSYHQFDLRFALALAATLLYYFSMVLGRVYCGMHGFQDLLVGSVIGLTCFVLRVLTRDAWDSLVLLTNAGIPLSVLLNYALIYFHITPIDDCPCFEDSVAFIGVIIGLDIADWVFVKSLFHSVAPEFGYHYLDTHYSYAEFGLLKTVLRIVISVLPVVLWKAFSKKALRCGLSCLFKPDTAVYSEPREAVIATINSKDGLSRTELADLDYHYQHFSRDLENIKDIEFTCCAFKKRTDLDLITRLFVYAGIPFIVIVVNPYFLGPLGLDLKP